MFTVHPLPRESAALISFGKGCSLFTPCIVNLLHRFRLGRDANCSPPAPWICCTDFVWEAVFTVHPLPPESAAQISFGKGSSLFTPCLVSLLHRFRLGSGVHCSPLPRESAAQISFGKGCSLFTPCLLNLLHRFRLGRGVHYSPPTSWICCTYFVWERVFTVHPCLVNLLHRFHLGRDVNCSPPASWICCTEFVWEGVFSAHSLLRESAAQISFGKECSLLTPCLVNLLHRFRLGKGVHYSPPAPWICCTNFVWEGVLTVHPLPRKSAAQISFGKGCSLFTPCPVNLLHRFRLVRGVHCSPPASWICCTDFVWERVFTAHPLPRESAAQISFGKGYSLFTPCLVNMLHRFRLRKGVHCSHPASWICCTDFVWEGEFTVLAPTPRVCCTDFVWEGVFTAHPCPVNLPHRFRLGRGVHYSPHAPWICCTDIVWEGVFTIHPLPRESAAQISFGKGCSLFTPCLVNLLHRFHLGRDVNCSPPASWICCTDFVWEGVFTVHPLPHESAAQISIGKGYSLLTPCLVNLLHRHRLGRGVH